MLAYDDAQKMHVALAMRVLAINVGPVLTILHSAPALQYAAEGICRAYIALQTCN